LTGGTAASFAYDGIARRRSKTVGGTTTSFLYDGSNFVQELTSGAPTANLLTGLDIDETFTRTDAGGANALLIDALGSALALADASGTVQTQYTFGPFGATTASGVTSANALQFAGRENDGTGLYNNRARYYSPGLQRFISEDPIGLAGRQLDLYAYVSDDPVNLADPSGLSSCGPEKDQCPKDKRRFFDWLDGPVGRMANDLSTSKALLLTLAANEGGWTNADLNHNIPLNNPFGVNKIKNRHAAGNIAYASVNGALGSWENLFGARVFGAQSPGDFVNGLQRPTVGQPYNTVNPDYPGQYLRVYAAMLKYMKLCGIQQ